ncbi:MAG: DUF502 domain-containing protein [Planctomycetes bacterium]|nr:DUF502 domain-containing protein [Planctomycetota bacterium]
MNAFTRHLSRCFLAGIVALLPIGGLVLTIVYLEYTIAQAWLAAQDFYIPGLGILLAVAAIYAIGLVVSTFLGRWIWDRADRLLGRLPALGSIYQTLKQILGYGEGRDAIFQRVVLVPARAPEGEEIGLVTSEILEDGKPRKLSVFVPGSPNPAAGRLLIIDPEAARPISTPVSDAMKTLISVGKTPLIPRQGAPRG